jgi:hypothetical protein
MMLAENHGDTLKLPGDLETRHVFTVTVLLNF